MAMFDEVKLAPAPVEGVAYVERAEVKEQAPAPLESALTVQEWEQLEQDVFDGDGAGAAVTAIRDYARENSLAPIPFLIASALYVSTCLPGNATFNAGVGIGSPNLFIAVVAKSGGGKDLLMTAVSKALSVSTGEVQRKPKHLPLGSGEGIYTALQPEKEQTVSDPVLFGMSEVNQLGALMGRTGSTLRGAILNMYSGNALGVTNKSETIYVEANSYTAGLWVGVQPDSAGVLLNGGDDGLKHRFVWTETVNPSMDVSDECIDNLVSAYTGKLDSHMQAASCLPVVIPQQLLGGKGFTFHEDIVRATILARRLRVKTGQVGEFAGHRNQTRLKLACGLALLSSRAHVSLDDWARAGALMDYSDKVQSYCQRHLTDRRVDEQVDRLDVQEQAKDSLESKRQGRMEGKIIDSLKDSERAQWRGRGGFLQGVKSNVRGAANSALMALIHRDIVAPIYVADEKGESVLDSLERGDKYPR